MKMHVVEYHKGGDYYLCRSEDGERHRLDLVVDSDLDIKNDREAVVGKDIELDDIQCYIGIGVNVRLSEESTPC